MIAKAKWFYQQGGLWGQHSHKADFLGLKYIVRYKPKCKSEDIICGTKTLQNENVIEYRPYKKSRGLYAYWYEVDFAVGDQAVYGYISF